MNTRDQSLWETGIPKFGSHRHVNTVDGIACRGSVEGREEKRRGGECEAKLGSGRGTRKAISKETEQNSNEAGSICGLQKHACN